MADKQILEQMLEHLVNEDQEKAEELFHEYVVAKSREIYKSLIEDEMVEEEKDEDEDEDGEDKEMEEAASDEDAEEDKVDEEFEDIAIEADDEMGGDPTDDLESEMDDAEDEGEDEGGEEEMMQDLGDIIDELQAKFDALQGAEEEQGEFDMGGEEEGEEEMKDDFELETVREYVEKVPAAKMGDSGENNGLKFSKNDMGGTSANILSSKEEAGTMAGQGQLKGNGLLKGTPKEDNAGNINVPGAKNGNAFSKKEPGHGAEKKGAAEQADKSAGSLFRGRR